MNDGTKINALWGLFYIYIENLKIQVHVYKKSQLCSILISDTIIQIKIHFKYFFSIVMKYLFKSLKQQHSFTAALNVLWFSNSFPLASK